MFNIGELVEFVYYQTGEYFESYGIVTDVFEHPDHEEEFCIIFAGDKEYEIPCRDAYKLQTSIYKKKTS